MKIGMHILINGILYLIKQDKLGVEDIEQYMAKWQGELAEARGMLANIDKNCQTETMEKEVRVF